MTGKAPAGQQVRVLIVDDSATARSVLTTVCNQDPRMTVVGEAADGSEAVLLTASLRPDIVVMDITMAGLDGYEATRQIMADNPTPVLLVTSAADPHSVDVAMRALEAGALTVMAKPTDVFDPGSAAATAAFRARVRLMSEVRVIRRYAGRVDKRRAAVAAGSGSAPAASVVAVAASVGGPQALAAFLIELARLDPRPPPIVAVQHIVRGFIGGFADWLTDRTGLRVSIAKEGESLQVGHVYLAPDDAHLVITKQHRIGLDHGPAVGGFRPSATVLFRAAGEAYQDKLTAVVLTGMGSDGLEGVRVAHRYGATVMAQDRESSVVFGMPGVVVAAGLAEVVAPVEQLARTIVDRKTEG